MREEVDTIQASSSSSSSSIFGPLLVILVPLVLVSTAILLLVAGRFNRSPVLIYSSSSPEVHATKDHARSWFNSIFFNRDSASSTSNLVTGELGRKKHDGSKKSASPRVFSKMEKLEAGLRRARSAIREAARSGNRTSPLLDADYVPHGPIYINAHAFHRSYLEMEKIFKVFVYNEGNPPLFHDGPCKGMYSTEGRFIHDMEAGNPFRTMDPDNAHMYFLPFSITKMVSLLYEYNHDYSNIKSITKDFVDTITIKYPYWNRSLGSDHFMLSCHDWGPYISKAIPYLYNNSVRVLCNANTSEGFNPSKDASLPEIKIWDGEIKNLTVNPSPSHRPFLGFFAGRLHGPVRPILLEHWKNKDRDLQVYKYLPHGMSYQDMMRKSRYCLCPSGYEVASPRIAEAIYAECVPVILSTGYVLPYSDVLNWSSFSVTVPVDDIPRLKSILMDIPWDNYLRLKKGVKQVQRHFLMNVPPKRYDVFHMLLHSIWLRRLNIRVVDPHAYNSTTERK